MLLKVLISEEKIKQLNLFVTGVGNVGERFLAQLEQQKDFLVKLKKGNIMLVTYTVLFRSITGNLLKKKIKLKLTGLSVTPNIFNYFCFNLF